jgi:hypothetical protein
MVIKSASEEEDPIRVPLGGLGLLHNNAVICRIFWIIYVFWYGIPIYMYVFLVYVYYVQIQFKSVY